MKNNIIVFLAVGLMLSSFSTSTTETFEAVIEASSISWAGSRPGKTHDGTLALSKGNLKIEDNNLVSGDFTIDMNSLQVSDIQPGKMNDRLVNHLKSGDFFDVENHQTASFEILGSQVMDQQIKVTGNLTIKGITNEVAFLAKLSIENDVALLVSDAFTIDRTLWDVKYRSGKFFDNLKNKLIEDNIEIKVSVKATKS